MKLESSNKNRNLLLFFCAKPNLSLKTMHSVLFAMRSGSYYACISYTYVLDVFVDRSKLPYVFCILDILCEFKKVCLV
jgi:hypothetical protein